MKKSYRDLRDLNAYRARVAVLDHQIPKLRALAAKMQEDVSIPTARYGDPAGYIHASGSHSNPTQRRALCDLPEDVAELLEDIRRLTIERHRTAARIELVEQALAFLPENERIIVELRAVEGMSWFDVVDAVLERTECLITERTARARYDRACVKIEPFFNTADIPTSA